VVFSDEIIDISPELFKKIRINIKDTLKARKNDKEVLDSALALEYAIPLLDKKGQEGPRRIINSASICNHPLEKRIAQEGKWPFPGCQFDM